MQRSIVVLIALAILFFAQPTTAPARKAAPDFSLEDSTGSLNSLYNSQNRESDAARSTVRSLILYA